MYPYAPAAPLAVTPVPTCGAGHSNAHRHAMRGSGRFRGPFIIKSRCDLPPDTEGHHQIVYEVQVLSVLPLLQEPGLTPGAGPSPACHIESARCPRAAVSLYHIAPPGRILTKTHQPTTETGSGDPSDAQLALSTGQQVFKTEKYRVSRPGDARGRPRLRGAPGSRRVVESSDGHRDVVLRVRRRAVVVA